MSDSTSVSLPGTAASGAYNTKPPGARSRARWWVLFLIALGLFFMLFPFYLAVINAVKTPADYAAHGPLSLPTHINLNGIETFWREVNFTRKLINSVIFSGLTALFAVILSLLNAYAIGIGRVRGSSKILVFLLLGIMIPQESLVYPLYWLAKSVGLFDSLTSVIIVFSVLQSAFGTYLLSAVLTTFPREIIEAAEIDGASRWQVLRMVVVPILRPTLAVLATFFFIWTWNEFLLPLVLLVSNDTQTVTVAMGVLFGQYTSDPTTTAAAALLGITPTVIFFLIFQRTLTKGVIVGAVK